MSWQTINLCPIVCQDNRLAFQQDGKFSLGLAYFRILDLFSFVSFQPCQALDLMSSMVPYSCLIRRNAQCINKLLHKGLMLHCNSTPHLPIQLVCLLQIIRHLESAICQSCANIVQLASCLALKMKEVLGEWLQPDQVAADDHS